MDRLADQVAQNTKMLRNRMQMLEEIVLEGKDGTEECYDYEPEAVNAFKIGLRPCVPMHVEGLQARPDLNGAAGMMKEWHAAKGRLAVLLGTEVLLLMPKNLVSSSWHRRNSEAEPEKSRRRCCEGGDGRGR